MKAFNHLVAAVLVLSASFAISAQAGITTYYGNFDADTVKYLDVTENMTAGTYGSPSVVGDSLTFAPVGVEALADASTSTNSISVQNDAQLLFGVTAKEGKAIAGLEFSELGDYSMIGSGFAFVDVTANFYVTIMDVDGEELDSAFTTVSSMTFSPNADGTVMHSAPFTQGVWDGDIYLDVLSMLTTEGISYVDGVTRMSVNLDNILVAYASPGGSSLIKKKDLTGFTVTSDVIPEPASLVLILGATSGLSFIRRRFVG